MTPIHLHHQHITQTTRQFESYVGLVLYVAQLVKYLTSIHKALGSIPSTTKQEMVGSTH